MPDTDHDVRDALSGIRHRDWMRDLFHWRPGPGEFGESQATGEEAKGNAHEAPTIPLPRSEPAMPVPGLGYVPPGLPPGLPRVAGSFTSETTPKDLRYPRPLGQIEKKVLTIGGASATPTVGGLAEFETSFPVRTVRVDNWSPQYVLIRGPEVYVPPGVFGAMIPMKSAPESVRVIVEAPPTVVQPAATAGSVVHIWAMEDELPPSPGASVSNGGGGATNATIVGPVTADSNFPADYAGGVETISHNYAALSSTQWARLFVASALGDGNNGSNLLAEALWLFNGTTNDRLRSISGVGDGLGVLAAMQPSSDNPPAAVVSAANAAATLTFAAVAGQTHRLTALAISYSGGAVAGRLTVSDGTNNILDLDIAATGPLVVPLPPGGIAGRSGAALSVTLAAGGAAVVGKISAAKLTA